MVAGNLRDMESFFDTLPNPFSESESEASKTSVVGEPALAYFLWLYRF